MITIFVFEPLKQVRSFLYAHFPIYNLSIMDQLISIGSFKCKSTWGGEYHQKDDMRLLSFLLPTAALNIQSHTHHFSLREIPKLVKWLLHIRWLRKYPQPQQVGKSKTHFAIRSHSTIQSGGNLQLLASPLSEKGLGKRVQAFIYEMNKVYGSKV